VSTLDAPRPDYRGYGPRPPAIRWPGDARLAICLVLNYEEGSERSLGLGDTDQESLSEWGPYASPPSIRNLAIESMHEYGSRVGVWRILRILEAHGVKCTFFACAKAFEETPEVARAAVAGGHEICSHGYRWEEVFKLSEAEEREHIRLAIDLLTDLTGQRPLGWYCRYGPSVRTRRLLVEEGGFVYDSDSYNDEIPYFVDVGGKKHVVVQYTPDVNDIQWWLWNGLATADNFFQYMKDSFDVLYEEAATQPKMMSVGLHCRIIGRPGRAPALARFIEYAKGFEDVWFATRLEVADWWLRHATSQTT
jgi:peptidoglycan/xylan/chitin deacetylase (PgdA/CDA1 family)